MALVQICSSDAPPAAPIITAMRTLLRARYTHKVTRKFFLVRWGILRRRLSKTEEYVQFRVSVCIRDGWKCRVCHKPTGIVHHLRPVARNLHLVMALNNAELRCNDCHKAEHPHMRKTA